MKFILSMPPPINQTYGVSRGGKIPFYKKKKVRDWEESAGWEIKHQWTGKKEQLEGNVMLVVNFYYSRNRDIDGGLKVLLDLLQRVRVYKDDIQVTDLNVHKEQDIENPRCEVEIYGES